MNIQYTVIQEPNKTDVHRFKLIDGTATIEVVETPLEYYYNVYLNGKLDGKHLTNKEFLMRYYEYDDGSDFGILVYRANETYTMLGGT